MWSKNIFGDEARGLLGREDTKYALRVLWSWRQPLFDGLKGSLSSGSGGQRGDPHPVRGCTNWLGGYRFILLRRFYASQYNPGNLDD
jgi:hypothetical protein